MPVAPTYPGVYLEEISSGVHTIIGVPTSITAFVGPAARGPVDTPTTIDGFADYERIFGGLWLASPMSFAVRDFFLNGGSQAVVVRLFSGAATRAADAAKAVADAATVAATAAGATAASVVTAATALVPNYTTDPSKSAVAGVVQAATTAAAAGGATPQTVAKAAVDAAGAYRTAQPSPNASGTVDDAKAAAAAKQIAADAAAEAGAQNATAASVAAKATATAGTIAAKAGVTPPEKDASAAVAQAATTASQVANASAADVAAAAKQAADGRGLSLVAATPGTWANSLRVRVEASPTAGQFNLIVNDPATGSTERYLNVSVAANSVKRLDKVLLQSNLVRANGLPAAAPTPHADPTPGSSVFADANRDKTYTQFSTAGSNGDPLTEADYTGGTTASTKGGLYALEKADLFNLLCIPPFALEGGDIPKSLTDAAAQYCAGRRAMLLIDPPSSWTDVQAAIDGVKAVSEPTKDAAVYFPRLRLPNPLRDYQVEPFAPCGAVAGVIARTDRESGVWVAPAGVDANLFGITDFDIPLTNAECGRLNPRGVNCLMNKGVHGNLVWGTRTREGDDQQASEWKYLPVRRTALYIEETLFRSTDWVVFKPNDEPLWAQIRLNIGAFMHGLFRQGAFQGGSPKDAYFVKCDKETNPQDRIDQGIVTVRVGFAPLKPAEFVIIQIQQMPPDLEV